MTISKMKYGIALANSGKRSSEVADVAGISNTRLNAIVNQKNVRPETAGKIAHALGVDVTEIIEK